MDLLRLLDKVPKKFTVADVQAQKVEAVSVITDADLQELLTTQVKDRTAQLAAELKHMKTRLAELEADRTNSGGIERAAAEAALEAEAKALEAQAAAELRAEQAEAKVRTLEAKGGAGGVTPAATAKPAGPDPKVADLEKKLAEAERKTAEAEKKAIEAEKKSSGGPKIPAGADPAKLEAAEKKLADSEKKLGEAEARAKAAEAKVAGLEADLAKAKSASPSPGAGAAAPAADDGPPAEPATPDDHKKARRLVDALLDDVVGEDEAKAKTSFGKKSFRTDFAKSLETARKQYVKRVKAHVRGEKDHWDEAIAALEAKG